MNFADADSQRFGDLLRREKALEAFDDVGNERLDEKQAKTLEILRFAFGEGILQAVENGDANASGRLKMIDDGFFRREKRVQRRRRTEIVEHVQNVVVKRSERRKFE